MTRPAGCCTRTAYSPTRSTEKCCTRCCVCSNMCMAVYSCCGSACNVTGLRAQMLVSLHRATSHTQRNASLILGNQQAANIHAMRAREILHSLMQLHWYRGGRSPTQLALDRQAGHGITPCKRQVSPAGASVQSERSMEEPSFLIRSSSSCSMSRAASMREACRCSRMRLYSSR